MAINFCRAHHSLSIRCNKLSLDGFEVENLISSEYERRRKGFLAASIISPPVEIVINFPHSIDISHIVLGLRNGSQHTSAVRLYTRCQDINETEGRSLQHIGSFENVSQNKFVFVNPKYKPTRLFKSFNVFNSPVAVMKKFSPKYDVSVSRVKSLKICIAKTSNNTVPVLSELQIWGQPGSDCSAELKKVIYDIEHGEFLKSQLPLIEEQISENVNSKNVQAENDDDIPAEFLDSITYEMMSQPVLLPSGNNVDRSTLEKYIETSSAWGRLPGDPFTGVPFGPLSSPASNVELKLRIDSFWLKNPHLCTGGRCTGVTNPIRLKYECENPSFLSRNKSNELKEDRGTLYDIYKPKFDCFESKLEDINSSFISETRSIRSKHNLPKIPKKGQILLPSSRKPKSETAHHGRHLKRSASSEIPIAAKALKKSIPDSYYLPTLTDKEHLKELSRSLEFGLKQVLSGKPTFISSSEDTEKNKSKNCSICNCLHLHGAYRLPCTHTLCRSCLVRETTSAQPLCKICNVSYLSSEVVRFYD